MVCKNCGSECEENTRFCTNCGADMTEWPVQEQPTVSSPQPYQMDYQQPTVSSHQPYQQSSQQAASAPGKGFAVASLVLGIVSFFCFAVVTGILAIIFGGVAKSKGYRGAMGTAGIACGIVGLALWLVMLIFMPNALLGLFGF